MGSAEILCGTVQYKPPPQLGKRGRESGHAVPDLFPRWPYDMRGLLHWEPESTNRLRQRRPLHMSHGSRGKRSGTRGQGWPLTGTRKTQDPHNGLDVWGVSVWSLWGPEVSCAGHTTGTGQGRFLTENSPKPLDRLINKGQKGMLVQSAALQNGGNR